MITSQFALMALAVALAAFIQGTIGFGFALIIAPIMAFLRPELLPVALLFLLMPLNLFTMLRERQALDWAGGGWITLGRAFGAVAGASVLIILSSRALNLLIGGATIATAVVSIAAPAFSPTRSAFVTVGLLTGISETATGIGGPPLVLAYQHHRPEVLRSTVAGCLLAGELLSLGVLGITGRTMSQDMFSAVLLVPFLAVGGFASSLIHDRVNGRLLRGAVIAFALASGAILLFRG